MIDLNDIAKPAEDLAEDLKEIVENQKDKALLLTTKAASVSLGRFLSMILLIQVFVAIFLTLSLAFVLLIGELLGSYTIGAFIVAALQVLAFVLLFRKRKTLFVNFFVKLFINVFYGDK